MSADTIPQRLLAQAKARGGEPAYYTRQSGQWVPTTWQRYAEQVQTAGRALLSLGFQPDQKICVLAFNRPEWVVADLGAMAAGGRARRHLPDLLPGGGRLHHPPLRGADRLRRGPRAARQGARPPRGAHRPPLDRGLRGRRRTRRGRRDPQLVGVHGTGGGDPGGGPPGAPGGHRHRGGGDVHLHLRHHRPAEGGDAQPQEPHVHRQRLGGDHGDGARGLLAVLPAAVAHRRADVHHARAHHRRQQVYYAESIERVPDNLEGGAAHRRLRCPSHLGEVPRPGHREAEAGPAIKEGLVSWAHGRRPRRSATSATAGRSPAWAVGAAARHRRQA